MIGYQEIHSADGEDHIYHEDERRWFVVWRGEREKPHYTTRKLARNRIRTLKRLRPGTQTLLPGLGGVGL